MSVSLSSMLERLTSLEFEEDRAKDSIESAFSLLDVARITISQNPSSPVYQAAYSAYRLALGKIRNLERIRGGYDHLLRFLAKGWVKGDPIGREVLRRQLEGRRVAVVSDIKEMSHNLRSFAPFCFSYIETLWRKPPCSLSHVFTMVPLSFAISV